MSAPLEDPDQTGPDDLREEISFYLEERARELEARGMEIAEARKVAERAFGNVEEVDIGAGREWALEAAAGGVRARAFSHPHPSEPTIVRVAQRWAAAT